MADFAVLASGSGSNFEAIARAVRTTDHRLVCLLCDQREAKVLERASRFAVPSAVVDYSQRRREEAELELISYLKTYGAQLVVLAGFMKLLTKMFIDAFPGKIINIHPSLLPRFPGVHSIERGYASNDSELGITIHYVDYGLDSGPVIMQKSFSRSGKETLEEIEERIHSLEHTHYPEVIIKILDSLKH